MSTITTTTEKKVTKAMRFTDIAAMLQGNPVVNGTTVDDAIDFINREMELLSRKNNSVSKKDKEKAAENVRFQQLIMEYLAGVDVGKTCTEITKAIPEFADISSQRVSALLRPLVKDGKVKSAIVKGRSLFSLA